MAGDKFEYCNLEISIDEEWITRPYCTMRTGHNGTRHGAFGRLFWDENEISLLTFDEIRAFVYSHEKLGHIDGHERVMAFAGNDHEGGRQILVRLPYDLLKRIALDEPLRGYCSERMNEIALEGFVSLMALFKPMLRRAA